LRAEFIPVYSIRVYEDHSRPLTAHRRDIHCGKQSDDSRCLSTAPFATEQYLHHNRSHDIEAPYYGAILKASATSAVILSRPPFLSARSSRASTPCSDVLPSRHC